MGVWLKNVCSALALIGLLGASGAHGKDRVLTLLQMNDVYSANGVDKGTRGGFARVATLVDRIKAENPNTHVVLAGDFLFPSADSILFRGAQMVAAMNVVPVDVVTLGNHEFDGGEAILKERIADSKFHWVSSNVRNIPKLESTRIENWGGIRVGFFGLLTEETKYSSHFGKQVVLPPIPAAKKAVADLKRRGAEVIVALTHLSIEEDQALARQIPGIDLILGGHEHTVVQSLVGKTLILKAGAEARDLGRIDLTVDQGKLKHIDFGLIPVTADILKAPRVSDALKKFEDQANAEWAKPVTEIKVALDASRDNRLKQTAFGNWLADHIRSITLADVGLVNGGSIRAEQVFPAGRLVRRDLFNTLPFPNSLVVREISGADLRAAMEKSIGQLPQSSGGYFQISGFEVEIDLNRAPGHRIHRIFWAKGGRFSGEVLPTQKMLLATTDFVAEGGDGYAMFVNSKSVVPAVGEGKLLLDLLISEAGKAEVWELPAQPETRIRLVHAP